MSTGSSACGRSIGRPRHSSCGVALRLRTSRSRWAQERRPAAWRSCDSSPRGADRVDLASGDHAGVVGELQKLVAENPLRETLRRYLIVALYRCGRQAGRSRPIRTPAGCSASGARAQPCASRARRRRASAGPGPGCAEPRARPCALGKSGGAACCWPRLRRCSVSRARRPRSSCSNDTTLTGVGRRCRIAATTSSTQARTTPTTTGGRSSFEPTHNAEAESGPPRTQTSATAQPVPPPALPPAPRPPETAPARTRPRSVPPPSAITSAACDRTRAVHRQLQRQVETAPSGTRSSPERDHTGGAQRAPRGRVRRRRCRGRRLQRPRSALRHAVPFPRRLRRPSRFRALEWPL